jgi:hypothetical protein
MNENSEIRFTESPASWNVRYVDPRGFVCQLTLRSDSGKELLEKVSNALSHLLEQGCQPYQYSRDGQNTKWCSTHNVSMRQYSKNGKTWYSHKLPSGEWCYGKPEKENGG